MKMRKQFEINQETDKKYEIEPSRFEKYPHLQILKQEAESISCSSTIYWKLRCRYLEKAIDETYTIFERDTCEILYLIMAKREK
jgi:hypothetical protein